MLYKWNVNEKDVENVGEITPKEAGIVEKDLENLIVNKAKTLIRDDQLFVIMQERPRQEEPDILALDVEGRLFIFELKRWESKEENILQVLRYGQKFGRLNYDGLAGYYKKFAEKNNLALKDLQEAHKEYFDFELSNPLEKEAFNKEQKFVIVANGKDYETCSAINYWKDKKIDIDVLVYRVFKIGGDVYLDFDPYGPFPDIPQDGEGTVFVVNTNKSYNPDAYKEMIKEKKAAAYGEQKVLVDKIKTGDCVCLYHNGVGIIAVGKAVSDCEEHKDKNEHFIKLKFDSCVDIDRLDWENKAVSAREINGEFKMKHPFRSTCFRLPSEIKDFVVEKLKERNGG